ncbi:hypothetical protein [Hymenobacter jeollabukensis]|uniref:Lipocalin-like domain-containing protein n=1 Tax=Hymenobacter jeollabukensis TaxID=2025313 RepID=A0A5R8WSJ3_9BACT|nr:hypothetical protein [Hymenobacter jeollabukensis]TLM93341.1 hypothetical protein FDY95_12045 [Hymenobacter jeollabukensis]
MLLRATLCLLLSTAAFTGCKTDKDALKSNGLTGYWQLSRQECFCPPGTPTPDEAVEFDGNGNVTEYQNGQAVQTGTYQLSSGSTDCAANAQLMTFSWSNNSPASYTLVDGKLTIDQGLCHDAPRKTYTLAPRRAGQ